MNIYNKINDFSLDNLEKLKQDKQLMLEYYGLDESDFDSLDDDLFNSVCKPIDHIKYQDKKRQLWHDFRVRLQDYFKEKQPPKAKISKVRKDLLRHKGKLSEYEFRFINDLKGKRKLTAKQESWLRDIAEKLQVVIIGDFDNKLSSKEKSYQSYNGDCQHEDLGSMGYQHGTTVACPFCGKMTEVW